MKQSISTIVTGMLAAVVLTAAPGWDADAGEGRTRGLGGGGIDHKPTVIPGRGGFHPGDQGKGSAEFECISDVLDTFGEGKYRLDWLRAFCWMGSDYADKNYPGGRPGASQAQRPNSAGSLKGKMAGDVRGRLGSKTNKGEDCCTVVSVDRRQRVVTAREIATGRTFRLKVEDANLLRNLRAGKRFGMSDLMDVQRLSKRRGR